VNHLKDGDGHGYYDDDGCYDKVMIMMMMMFT
jgi:hypothetical protein